MKVGLCKFWKEKKIGKTQKCENKEITGYINEFGYYYVFLYKFLYKRRRIMKIKIIALSAISLCASQAFGTYVVVHNATSDQYAVKMTDVIGDWQLLHIV